MDEVGALGTEVALGFEGVCVRQLPSTSKRTGPQTRARLLIPTRS